MAEPQWFPFYVGDYLRDTSRLTTEQHGAYLLLLFDQWANGPLPDDDLQLASIARLSVDRWLQVRPSLERFFRHEKGAWENRRVEIERDRAKGISVARKKAGKASWINRVQAPASRLLKQNTDFAKDSYSHKDPYQGSKPLDQASSPLSTDPVDDRVVRLPLPGRGAK